MMMMMMHHLCVSLPLAIGPSLVERWTWNLSTAQQSQCKLYIHKTGTDVSAQVLTGKNFKDKPSACHILELNLGRWINSPAFFFFLSSFFIGALLGITLPGGGYSSCKSSATHS